MEITGPRFKGESLNYWGRKKSCISTARKNDSAGEGNAYYWSYFYRLMGDIWLSQHAGYVGRIHGVAGQRKIIEKFNVVFGVGKTRCSKCLDRRARQLLQNLSAYK